MSAKSQEPHWLFDISRPRALLVVAHPDDETIFAGGMILRSTETRWTVVCFTHEGNQNRKDEFVCACRFLDNHSGSTVEPVFLDLMPQQDENREYDKLVQALKPYSDGYDIVFTHNSQGEYGHEDHKIVHRLVVDIIGNKNTWVFISPGSKNVNQDDLRSNMANGNYSLDLSPEVLSLKVRTVQECHASQAKIYGYDPASKKLCNTDLRDTLSWYFEESNTEEYTFCQ